MQAYVSMYAVYITVASISIFYLFSKVIKFSLAHYSTLINPLWQIESMFLGHLQIPFQLLNKMWPGPA